MRFLKICKNVPYTSPNIMSNSFHTTNQFSNASKCITDVSSIDPLVSIYQAAFPPYLYVVNSYGPTKGGSKTPTLRFFIRTKFPGENLTILVPFSIES